jgi:hypothetical protein
MASLAFAGCVDRVSTLGLQYYTDTIGTSTSIRNDTGFIHFADTVRPFVTTSPNGINSFSGIDYGLTDSTTLMMIGKVSNPYPGDNDNLEAWGLLQFPPTTSDTMVLITGVQLILKDGDCSYGDTTSSRGSQVSFNVYGAYSTGNEDYDTVSVPLSALPSKSTLVGSIIIPSFPDSIDRVLTIPLPPSTWKSNLTSPFFNFIVTPMEGSNAMTNVRGFGTIHSYSDANSIPQLEYYLNNGDSVFRAPSVDLFYVQDMNMSMKTLPPGEFMLRGGAGERERINLNLTRPTDTAHLSPFTTINNAVLVLHLDVANSSHSNVEGDTLGPDIVQLGLVDSGGHYEGNGTIDSTSPTNTTYHFQVRGIVQNWLADTATNLGFELRAGYSGRSFDAPDPESIGVEDNTVNRWTFYGPNCPDLTKRPYFILSYSKLK